MTTTIAPSNGHGPLTDGGTGASPGFSAIDFRRLAAGGKQEGAMDTHCFEVVQRGAGATQSVDITANVADALGSGVAAYVQGDAVSFQSLFPVAPHSSVINESVAAAHASLPRIDSVILEIKDNAYDASGSNLAQVRVLTGTATSGATLDNRTGAPALPSSALLLADLGIAPASSSVTNANIRDRRKWALGAQCKIVRSQNASAGNDYTVGASYALVDSVNMYPRIECSGVPIRVCLAGVVSAAVATASTFLFEPWIDGTPPDSMSTSGLLMATNIAGAHKLYFEWIFTPSAGSHRIGPAVASGGITYTLLARSGFPILWTVEELQRQTTANNATTTG
jgi:hypothetical protein